jgi:multidrug transporter EmrE-like cation transporter
MRYAKFFVAAGIAGLTVLAAALTDDHVTNAEWIAIGLAVLGALGVWAVPNKPDPEPAPSADRRTFPLR